MTKVSSCRRKQHINILHKQEERRRQWRHLWRRKETEMQYDNSSTDLEQGRHPRSKSGTLLSEERYEIGHDVYGLIFVSPTTSPSFIFAFIVVAVKFGLFTLLLWDLYNQETKDNAVFAHKENLVRAAQFLLLPIAIALQEDLIYVYTRIANIKYTEEISEVTPSATQTKFALSFCLRLVDGMASLTINFVLILTADDVLGIFLNFAALHFLQGIDDVAFEMANEGFLGDRMEDRCRVVKETTMARRVGDSFTNSLDSVLFSLTYFCMVAVWTYVYIYEQNLADSLY